MSDEQKEPVIPLKRKAFQYREEYIGLMGENQFNQYCEGYRRAFIGGYLRETDFKLEVILFFYGLKIKEVKDVH